MADVVDTANDIEEIMLAAKLTERKQAGPAATGRCLNCEEELADKAHRWCDADCRKDWEIFNARGTYD